MRMVQVAEEIIAVLAADPNAEDKSGRGNPGQFPIRRFRSNQTSRHRKCEDTQLQERGLGMKQAIISSKALMKL